jgi:hypothetical protein
MAPFSLFFILLDLFIRSSDGTSFNNHGRSEENTADGIFAMGAKGKGRFGHPLDDLKTSPAVVAASI